MDNNLAVILSLIGVLGTVLGGLIVYYSNKNFNNAKTQDLSVDTYLKLSKRIDDLEERDAKKEERIDWLQNELRRYINAYSLAIKYIHYNVHGDIPNFLETDPAITKVLKK